MIEVRINEVPYGNYDKAHDIAECVIIDDGTGNKEIGNYQYFLYIDNELVDEGKLINFERQQGVWTLVKEILDQSIIKR